MILVELNCKCFVILYVLSASCCSRKFPDLAVYPAELLDVEAEVNKPWCGDGSNSSVLQDYTFLYQYLTGTGAHSFHDSVTIGFLAAYGQTQVVLGALPLAVEAVNSDRGLFCLNSVI